jgi:hypothetical protein
MVQNALWEHAPWGVTELDVLRDEGVGVQTVLDALGIMWSLQGCRL